MGDFQLAEKKTSIWKVAVLCLVSGFLNSALSHVISGMWGLPLYLDTLFAAAVCFSFGLIPGLVTALLHPVFLIIKYIALTDLELAPARLTFLFVFCIFFEVLLIFSFRNKIKPLDNAFRKQYSLVSFINLAPMLLLLAVLDCVVISVSGGIIDYIITLNSKLQVIHPEDSFKLSLLRNNVPVMASVILSRIPINIVDRFFVIFGGYGVSLLYRKMV